MKKALICFLSAELFVALLVIFGNLQMSNMDVFGIVKFHGGAAEQFLFLNALFLSLVFLAIVAVFLVGVFVGIFVKILMYVFQLLL